MHLKLARLHTYGFDLFFVIVGMDTNYDTFNLCFRVSQHTKNEDIKLPVTVTPIVGIFMPASYPLRLFSCCDLMFAHDLLTTVDGFDNTRRHGVHDFS